MLPRTHTHTHTHTQTHKRTCTRKRTHACSRACTHRYTHKHTYTLPTCTKGQHPHACDFAEDKVHKVFLQPDRRVYNKDAWELFCSVLPGPRDSSSRRAECCALLRACVPRHVILLACDASPRSAKQPGPVMLLHHPGSPRVGAAGPVCKCPRPDLSRAPLRLPARCARPQKSSSSHYHCVPNRTRGASLAPAERRPSVRQRGAQ